MRHLFSQFFVPFVFRRDLVEPTPIRFVAPRQPNVVPCATEFMFRRAWVPPCSGRLSQEPDEEKLKYSMSRSSPNQQVSDGISLKEEDPNQRLTNHRVLTCNRSAPPM
jgi:hypothetical protein